MARISSQARRDQLVEAAVRVATRDGIDAVTTRTVAAEAGATPGIVHYVYRSMDDLLHDTFTTVVDRQMQLVASVQVEGTSVRECLESAFETWWDTVESRPEAHRLTYDVTQFALRNDDLGGLMATQYERYVEAAVWVLDAVAQAARVVWTRSVDSLARQLVAAHTGILLAWLIDHDSRRARETYAHTIDYLANVTRPAE